LVALYARNTVGCFLLLDITEKDSFADLPNWLGFLRENLPEAFVVLFAHKLGLDDERQV
jgi:GTPase SAR1 family protein